MSKEDYYTVIGEEDNYNWTDNKTGLKCHMKRNARGAWCGYVGLPKTHKFFEMSYQELGESDIWLSVHGGLTYSGWITASPYWWLGFDCAHMDDLMPKMPGIGGTYRNVDYVKAQCAQLAYQLTKI